MNGAGQKLRRFNMEFFLEDVGWEDLPVHQKTEKVYKARRLFLTASFFSHFLQHISLLLPVREWLSVTWVKIFFKCSTPPFINSRASFEPMESILM